MHSKLFYPSTLAWLLCITLLMNCTTANIYSNYDKTVNFQNYKTFAWSPYHQNHSNSLIDNDIVAKNIRETASKELESRGLQANIDEPDLLIDYDIFLKDRVRTEQYPIYNYRYNYRRAYPYRPWGRYYNPRNTGYSTSYERRQVPYKEGTLIIELIDRKTNTMIWHGWAVETVDDPNTYQEDINKDIQAIFKRFPLQPLSSTQERK
jgi:hypothetical protein